MNSIRRQLTARFLYRVIPLIVCGLVIVYITVRQVVLYEFDSALKQEARVLEAVTERVGNGIDFDYRPGTDPKDTPDFGQDYRFELTLSDGSLLERSDLLRGPPLDLPAGELGQARISSVRLPNGHWARGVSLTFEPKVVDSSEHVEPVDRPNAPSGPVRLVIVASTHDLDNLLAALAITEVLVALLLVAATAALLLRSIREGLAPVEVLAQEVTAIEPENLTARVSVSHQPDELRPIAARVNQLLDRLEEAFARERRFTANAAHELRTPIAEIRAIAEVAADSLGKDGSASPYGEIVKVTGEMQAMISNLLMMARARSGTLQVQPRSVDLSALLSDWCAKREAPAHEVGQRVQREIKEGVQTRTDPLVLSAIINNLLDNAISYSHGTEPIIVRLTQTAGECCISVENSCEPMEAQDVEGMFEPFWRKRGTTVNGNHSGLGLALVRALCEAIRVTVHAQLLSSRRLAVSVTVPQDHASGTD